MAKSANLYARIEPETKKQAESILAALGIPASNAINMFYKQIILQQGIPFDVKITAAKPLNISEMAEVQLSDALDKGYSDIESGQTKAASKVFADIRKDHKL